MGNYKMALHYAYESRNIRDEQNLEMAQNNLGIGKIYNYIGNKDSAYYYLEQATVTDIIYTKRSAYRVLYNLAKEEKNYEKAMEYGDPYRFYADSIQRVDRSSTRIDMQICCLVKLRLGIPEMAVLPGISPTSVSKRKLRLKERIVQKVGNHFNQEQTLDLWIGEY